MSEIYYDNGNNRWGRYAATMIERDEERQRQRRASARWQRKIEAMVRNPAARSGGMASAALPKTPRPRARRSKQSGNQTAASLAMFDAVNRMAKPFNYLDLMRAAQQIDPTIAPGDVYNFITKRVRDRLLEIAVPRSHGGPQGRSPARYRRTVAKIKPHTGWSTKTRETTT